MGLPFWVSVKSGNLCMWPFLQKERGVQGFCCLIYSVNQQRCNNHCCLCKMRQILCNGLYYLKYLFHHCFHVIKIPIDSLNKISAGVWGHCLLILSVALCTATSPFMLLLISELSFCLFLVAWLILLACIYDLSAIIFYFVLLIYFCGAWNQTRASWMPGKCFTTELQPLPHYCILIFTGFKKSRD